MNATSQDRIDFLTWIRILTSGQGGVQRAERFTRWGIESPLRLAGVSTKRGIIESNNKGD